MWRLLFLFLLQLPLLLFVFLLHLLRLLLVPLFYLLPLRVIGLLLLQPMVLVVLLLLEFLPFLFLPGRLLFLLLLVLLIGLGVPGIGSTRPGCSRKIARMHRRRSSAILLPAIRFRTIR